MVKVSVWWREGGAASQGAGGPAVVVGVGAVKRVKHRGELSEHFADVIFGRPLPGAGDPPVPSSG
ncbi:MAG: hypothetical protein ACRDQA_28190 [Nocardioidaceae bacterium]